jgi:Trk K+ transport system NAD-binding subunit
MKYLPSQIAYLLGDRGLRSNLGALLRYIAFLSALVVLYAILFHVIMERVEGRSFSWVTGLYWVLVVMTTLGFGDITFTSDTGRLFSVVVLLSGVIFLLVMLPVLFIRLFYAPWLEARMRTTAPRRVADTVIDHVVITEYDAIAIGLIRRLQTAAIPYVVIEPDPAAAAQLFTDGVSVVTGEVDSADTYQAVAAARARLIVVNREDTTNTNITLTIREVAPRVPVTATVEEEDSVDILELSGATRVLPLKAQLGSYLAHRLDLGKTEAQIVGAFRDLLIAELPVRFTPFGGCRVQETRLREIEGMSVAGIWMRGRLVPAYPNTVIDPAGVLVIAGTRSQLERLKLRLMPPESRAGETRVVIIGAGGVGRAAAAALRNESVRTSVVERDAQALAPLAAFVDRVTPGDAADRNVLFAAGLSEATSVLLTTNDDAMNIYLAVYCRRLKPDLRIVSRITHERNVEAIHRAGADFVLSYASLGAETLFAQVRNQETVILGEGVALFARPVPATLEGRTLQESAIGRRTGLCVIALQDKETFVTELRAETVLKAGAELVMIGNLDQRRAFSENFGRA